MSDQPKSLTTRKAAMPTPHTLETALTTFLADLRGRNLNDHTSLAYQTDIRQFIAWIHSEDVTITTPQQVSRATVTEYLVSLTAQDILPHSPVASISMPKKERKARLFLRPEEYNRMLAAAGSHPRDFAILQVFLQTDIRVSELVNLTLPDIDLHNPSITIHGKGNKERVIDLALKRKPPRL